MTNKSHLPINLLLIEDDDIDAMGISRAFSKAGVNTQIHRAHDGIEALEILRSSKVERPFLILLDLNMPRMNGHEFLKEVRDDPKFKKSLVFVLTTSTSESDVDNAYQKCVAGYIAKSSLGRDLSQLVRLIQRYWELVEFPHE